MHQSALTTRRGFVSSAAALLGAAAFSRGTEEPARKKALIAITLDLEMSAEYPRRGITEWNFQKGNLDDATKKYAVEVALLEVPLGDAPADRKSTRLNSSHSQISYAVFCLKQKQTIAIQ